MSFTALKKTHDAYIDLTQGFSMCLDEIKAITTAAEERIETDKAKNAERVAILKERLSDPSVPPSVQRMAEAELSELEQIRVETTQREREAFAEAVNTANDIISDMTELERRFRDELKAAQEELASMRADILGDQARDLRPRWIEGKKERFCSLWG